jgi:putative protease
MDEPGVREKLLKLGGTPYVAECVTILLDEGLMVPVSRLNALRRSAIEALSAGKAANGSEKPPYLPTKPVGARIGTPTARFQDARQITPAARAYFSHLYLPLHAYDPVADGVVLPAVIFDDERERVREQLKNAVEAGARLALIGNVGHLSLATEAGLIPHGDFRLNVTNKESLAVLLAMGFADVLLSPELTLPQIRDLTGACDAIVYGRIPLMTLEKCVGKELGGCEVCRRGETVLVDRLGERFPVLKEPQHRSVIVNSRPTGMSDKEDALRRAGITGGHFLFTTESPHEVDEVLAAYETGKALPHPVRRI